MASQGCTFKYSNLSVLNIYAKVKSLIAVLYLTQMISECSVVIHMSRRTTAWCSCEQQQQMIKKLIPPSRGVRVADTHSPSFSGVIHLAL